MLNFITTKAHAYTPLTDIGDFSQIIITGAKNGLPTDLNGLVNFAFYTMIAVAVVFAIFGVIRGGYVYLTSADSGSNKSRAKRILQASVGGLLLALGGWLILNTINPQILNSTMEFTEVNKPNVINFKDLTTTESREKINALLSDGFQEADGNIIARDPNLLAFFGEKTDEDILTTLNDQMDLMESGADDYRGFLKNLYKTKLDYENDYYMDIISQKRISTDRSVEINAIDSILNRFESMNNNLPAQHQTIFTEEKSKYLNDKELLSGDGIKLNL